MLVTADGGRNLHGVEGISNKRIGANESLFRETNEGIERGLWPGEAGNRVPFRCECALPDCAEAIRVQVLPEYERVRTNPRRFVVIPGHEVTRAESVIERHPDYLLVEKIGEAASVAEELDPRS